MKKVAMIAALALFVACNSNPKQVETTTDSTAVDTTVVDSCKTVCDTTKKVDTAN